MNTVSKFLISLFALAYLTFMGFGVSLTVMMEEHGMVQSHCPFMPGESGMCAMNLLDHLQGWQAATVAVVEPVELLVIAFVSLSLVLAFGLHHRRISLWLKMSLRYSLPSATDPPWKLYQPLQRAFSSGILQPKLF